MLALSVVCALLLVIYICTMFYFCMRKVRQYHDNHHLYHHLHHRHLHLCEGIADLIVAILFPWLSSISGDPSKPKGARLSRINDLPRIKTTQPPSMLQMPITFTTPLPMNIAPWALFPASQTNNLLEHYPRKSPTICSQLNHYCSIYQLRAW